MELNDVNVQDPNSINEYAKSIIDNVQYYHFEGTNATVCCIQCKNGYVVVGDSSCISDKKFSLELGKQYAYEVAFDKLIGVVAYLLHDIKD